MPEQTTPFWLEIKTEYIDANLEKVIDYLSKESQLAKKNELYDGLVKFCLSSKSRLTEEAGEVKTKFSFKGINGNVIRESKEIVVNIYDEDEWHNKGDEGSSGDDSGCDCDIDKIIERLRPLTYESVEAAETSINSGEVKHIYLGQNVIIIQDGKYLLYSVQQGTDGYKLDPVDTYGESAVWDEDE